MKQSLDNLQEAWDNFIDALGFKKFIIKLLKMLNRLLKNI